MQTQQLSFHGAMPPLAVLRVDAKWGLVGSWLQLRWRVEGARKVLVPPFTGRRRSDGLWQDTCFEMFVQPSGGAAYAEFNFSPSEAWAAYGFEFHLACDGEHGVAQFLGAEAAWRESPEQAGGFIGL
jgi:hypothetical protein